MNIRQISYTFLSAAMLACASSCTETYVNKAKKQAVKYLNGEELLEAEKYVRNQDSNGSVAGPLMMYWDSLLNKAKSDEAYKMGIQAAKDSAEGKVYSGCPYTIKFDTILPQNPLDDVIAEYAKNTSAEELIEAREKAPGNFCAFNHFSVKTHYWNMIRTAKEQQKAFARGKADAQSVLSR